MNKQNQLPYSNDLKNGISDFLDSNLHGMSRNLCKVFFGYLRSQTAGLDIDFDTILNDIEAIINFLEIAGDEMKHK